MSKEPRFSPGPPKRLAQGIGLAISATSLVTYFGFGRKRPAYGLLGALIVASGLEALFGYCLACRMFPLLVKAGLVSEETCRTCARGQLCQAVDPARPLRSAGPRRRASR